MAGKETPSGKPTTSSIVAAYDWGVLGHVVDVGGGDGTLLIALLNEYPTLRGTVVDLPDVAENARKRLDAAGLADRGDVVAGDFFGALPAGAEGYLLCSVLHQWSDDEARAILRGCASAATEDGAVFVIEPLPAPEAHARAEIRPDGERVAGDGDRARGARADGGPADGEPLDGTGAGSPRDVGELMILAESADLTVAAVHTADGLAILELAVP